MDANGYLSFKAYLLNFCGSDIPHHLVSHVFLIVGLESATIFLEARVHGFVDVFATEGVGRRKVRVLIINGFSYIDRISPGSDISSNVLYSH